MLRFNDLSIRKGFTSPDISNDIPSVPLLV
jgi:hypothetical protein